MKARSLSLKTNNSFTLMEIMITAVVVSVLAGIALMGYTASVQTQEERDKIVHLSAHLAAQEMYRARHGEYWFKPGNGASIAEINAALGTELPEDGSITFTLWSTANGSIMRTGNLCIDSRYKLGVGRPDAPGESNPCCWGPPCKTLKQCSNVCC